MTKKDIIIRLEEEQIRSVQLWFTDILGRLKSITVSKGEMEHVLEYGQGFDGSSIEGLVRIHESDLVLIPEPETFRILPFDLQRGNSNVDKTAIMFCEIQTPDGELCMMDSRNILKMNLQNLAKEGYTLYVGPEYEFFYFKSNRSPELLDAGGYFDFPAPNGLNEIKSKTIMALEEMGICVEGSHHEVAPSQYEIDLKYQEALKMADTTMIFKFVVKYIAAANGFFASFMPKPISDVNGSGMHTHISMFKDGKNSFYDEKSDTKLSTIARSFMAGIMRHASELTLVTNQWVNSYKRLVAGFEAPVYIAWGRKNRSALVRVPHFQEANAARVEFRCPDTACNPYLTFSAIASAGLTGIRNKYDLEPPIELDIYRMDAAERKEHGIRSLPDSLESAIAAASQSAVLKDALGESLFLKLIENKTKEWEDYRSVVTSYELERYLPIL